MDSRPYAIWVAHRSISSVLSTQASFLDRAVIVGRYDPNDYIDVLGYANPWTGFQNLAILMNTTIALPDTSYGIGGGTFLKDQWYILGTLNDANGTIDSLEFFQDGAEFFGTFELGWTPSRADRYAKNFHATYWHVDERETKGVPRSDGITFGANWLLGKEWFPFFRAGWSDGGAPLMEKTVSVGFGHLVNRRSDTLGLGGNWGDPSDATLRDQYTAELFYKFQFAQNLAITPSVQWLVDPALNPDEDQLWVFGLRGRLTL